MTPSFDNLTITLLFFCFTKSQINNPDITIFGAMPRETNNYVNFIIYNMYKYPYIRYKPWHSNIEYPSVNPF